MTGALVLVHAYSLIRSGLSERALELKILIKSKHFQKKSRRQGGEVPPAAPAASHTARELYFD